ncbi:LytR family transcriptional regulator [Glaciihabitans sp. INWT7]|uniref:LCP family protein n=1 Tax=Glaciihabitans sp. INWT7 TaxID=2596912 RepID=UPI001623BD8B|nr:LCP family protein [Glaciihabitans sp. INWT7]QNE46362.1 LytR family transcriptional regulator [Glaciihabitans sp. INWT7]
MPSTRMPPVARHGRLPRSRPAVTVLAFLASALAVVLVSVGAVAGFAVYDVAKSVQPGVKLIGQTDGPPPDIGSFEGGINVLVAASDSGGGDVGTYGKRGEHLNDVTMLLHVSADHSNATVVSFPRDLIVPIASCPNPKGGNFPSQTNKINVALTYGGLPCIVKTVENLTGLTIPYAALTEFQGVVGLSNAVGGVTVCIAKAIHDEQIHFDLDAGQRTLVGQDAVQFLRVRYGVGDGSDLARISNQQLFLSALVRKIKTPETLGNPVKDYALAKAVIDNTTRSDSLNNLTTLVSMALAVKDISFDKVVFVQYPGSYGSAAGQNGVLPIRSAAEVLFTALKNDQPVSLTGKTGDGTTNDPSATTARDPGASTPASGAATTAPGVALPSSATGQTAAQATCTKGQRAKG